MAQVGNPNLGRMWINASYNMEGLIGYGNLSWLWVHDLLPYFIN